MKSNKQILIFALVLAGVSFSSGAQGYISSQ